MLATVGWLAGRSSIDRVAWSAVAFGVWDIGYYAWLWHLSGWPSSPGMWDLLFLVPVPWVGPVWAPVIVSAALIGFGLAAARRLHAGQPLGVDRGTVACILAGGALVVLSFTWDAARILAGGTPRPFPWPSSSRAWRWPCGERPLRFAGPLAGTRRQSEGSAGRPAQRNGGPGSPWASRGRQR